MADDTSLENYTPEEVAAMGQLYAKLAKDPKTRETILRATKAVDPNVSIPEIDVFDRVQAATKPLNDQVTRLTLDNIQKDQLRRLDAARQELADAGHSKEEIAEIEKLMIEEKKAGNHLTHKRAADFFKMQKQTATPVPSSIRTMEMPVGKDAIKKAGGIRRWGAIEAGSAIDDLRSGRVKVH